MADSILNKLVSVKQGIGLCWLGNIGWLIYSAGKLIAFDLDLESEMRLQKSPVGTAELAPVLNYHFITHGHGDHFSESTSRILAKGSDCIFIIPSNCVQKARQIGIPEERLIIAYPGTRFNFPGIDVLPLKAIHGHKNFSILGSANLDDCGYKLVFGGKVFLQPGDSVLLEEHLEQTDVNVLFISPTEHNMHIDKSSILISALKPDHIFAQHFGTYKETDENRYWTRGYPDELRKSLPGNLRRRFVTPEIGSIMII
ncbi:MAG: MBL fold metallo-hydrolase [Bacteroidales bacterium]|nr:MBL fold metallo-hydrolase [Bacteroidales bacterium]